MFQIHSRDTSEASSSLPVPIQDALRLNGDQEFFEIGIYNHSDYIEKGGHHHASSDDNA